MLPASGRGGVRAAIGRGEQEAARSAGEGARPGRGGDDVQTLGTKWPHSTPTASPAFSQSGGLKGGKGRPRWPAGPEGRGPERRGQHPTPRYSPRAGAARHSHSASSAHSGAGRRAGIFSVASSSAAAAWADPHGEGVPTEEPPLFSPLLLLLPLTA